MQNMTPNYVQDILQILIINKKYLKYLRVSHKNPVNPDKHVQVNPPVALELQVPCAHGLKEHGSPKYNTIQCSAVHCSAVQSSMVQCNTIQNITMQCNIIQYNTIQCNAMQCCNSIQ
jgi:hypothetical protein